MISVSGIRGVFGTSLTPENVLKYATYFGIYCQMKQSEKLPKDLSTENRKIQVVIGRDSRLTGRTLCYAVRSALISVGCNVIDLGVVATPTLLFSTKELHADGGICITASHNPAQWNALKLCSDRGMFLFPEEVQQFHQIMENKIVYADWDKQGQVITNYDMIQSHIDKILSIPYVNNEKIYKKKFKVVIDSVNGAGGLISPYLLKKLGCEVININEQPTGIFAHNPEPLGKNLQQLQEAVLSNKADIGFATDPDVDRLSIISNKGEAIGEELSLVLAAKYVLSRKQGDIVTNCSTTMAIEDIADFYRRSVYRTKVGEINVGKKMLEMNAAVGGEGNGGIICPEVNYTRDACAGMAIILGLLAEEDLSISQIVDQIPKYFITKDKVELQNVDFNKVVQQLQEFYFNQTIDKTDGLKIIDDNYWIHIRKSGTEPIIRIYVESDSQDKSNSLCLEAKTRLILSMQKKLK